MSAGLALHLATFVVFGGVFGVWQVLLPELSAEVAPTPGSLGAAISIGFVGSLPVMFTGGRLVDRFGTRPVGVAAGLLFAASAAALAMVGSYAALLVVLAVFYAASGAYDVAINAAAIDWEAARRRRVMTMLHAGFSGGAMGGALLTGAALAVGVDYRLLYPLAGVLVVVVMAAWWRGPRRPVAHQPAESLGGAPIWRDRLLLLLGLAAALAFVIEGAMEAWSAIYFRSGLGMPALVGASGVALFHGAMTLGRLANVAIQRRLGRRGALRLGGFVAAVGMAAALATDVPLVVLLSFGVVGLAVSGAAPIALSLAGDSRPGESGRASSAVTVVGYSGFIIGPALIGGVAQLAGLRVGLGLVAIAGLGIAAIGQALNARHASTALAQPVSRPGAR